MTQNVEGGSGSELAKLILALLVLAVGIFLWAFVSDYSNNIYVQSSPIIGILADFRLAANLFIITLLTLTLVVLKTRKTIR